MVLKLGVATLLMVGKFRKRVAKLCQEEYYEMPNIIQFKMDNHVKKNSRVARWNKIDFLGRKQKSLRTPDVTDTFFKKTVCEFHQEMKLPKFFSVILQSIVFKVLNMLKRIYKDIQRIILVLNFFEWLRWKKNSNT